MSAMTVKVSSSASALLCCYWIVFVFGEPKKREESRAKPRWKTQPGGSLSAFCCSFVTHSKLLFSYIIDRLNASPWMQKWAANQIIPKQKCLGIPPVGGIWVSICFPNVITQQTPKSNYSTRNCCFKNIICSLLSQIFVNFPVLIKRNNKPDRTIAPSGWMISPFSWTLSGQRLNDFWTTHIVKHGERKYELWEAVQLY